MSNKHHLPHSSSIAHIDYDDANKELEIAFTSGGIHTFKNCEREHYEGMKKHKSPGTYFHQHIRRRYLSERKE